MPCVLFITETVQAPSTRYRAVSYFPYLEQAGWRVEHRALDTGLARRWGLLPQAARADVVVVVRKTFRPILRWPLRVAAKRLVFDFDDALFVRDTGELSARKLRRCAAMVRRCDAVWAGNAYLAEQARRYNPNVLVLPTAIETRRYHVTPPKPTDHCDAVWIGHQGTRKYLDGLLPVLEEAAGRIPNLRLKIIADFGIVSPRLPTVMAPWSQETEATELASAHVGLAPLPDDPWTRGKCGLRTLQYMAAGLPVVASDIAAHRDIVIPQETGWLPTSPQEWIAALTLLARDAGQREKMGAAGKTRVQKYFSLEVTSRLMLEALDALRR